MDVCSLIAIPINEITTLYFVFRGNVKVSLQTHLPTKGLQQFNLNYPNAYRMSHNKLKSNIMTILNPLII